MFCKKFFFLKKKKKIYVNKKRNIKFFFFKRRHLILPTHPGGWVGSGDASPVIDKKSCSLREKKKLFLKVKSIFHYFTQKYNDKLLGFIKKNYFCKKYDPPIQ